LSRARIFLDKFGFVGERENAKGKLLERSFPLDTLQELSKKILINNPFFKSFRRSWNPFSKGFQVGVKGVKPPCAPLQTAI
jgi:hypothetical protein